MNVAEMERTISALMTERDTLLAERNKLQEELDKIKNPLTVVGASENVTQLEVTTLERKWDDLEITPPVISPVTPSTNEAIDLALHGLGTNDKSV